MVGGAEPPAQRWPTGQREHWSERERLPIPPKVPAGHACATALPRGQKAPTGHPSGSTVDMAAHRAPAGHGPAQKGDACG